MKYFEQNLSHLLYPAADASIRRALVASLAFQWICYIHRSNMSSTWSLAARVHRSQRLISHGLIDEVSSRLVKSRTGMHFIGRKGGTENAGGGRGGEGERQERIYITRERDREGETYEEGWKAVKGKSKRYRYAQGISDRRTGLAISRWVIVRRIQCTQVLNEARKFIQKKSVRFRGTGSINFYRRLRENGGSNICHRDIASCYWMKNLRHFRARWPGDYSKISSVFRKQW